MSTGAGMTLVPILALQEALVIGLHALAQDRRAVEELVGREDQLQYSTADAWRRALRDALFEMLDPASDQYVRVVIGPPSPPGAAQMPLISLVISGGGENTAEAVCGNHLRDSVEFHGPDQEAWLTSEYGGGQTTTVEIAAWSPAPERAALLIGAVRWVIYQQTEDLAERGIHEITFREGGFEVNPAMEPRVAFAPTLSVTLSWTFRESVRRKIPNRVRIERGSFS